MDHSKKIIRNIARCKLCKDVIESGHVHDFKFCKCGAIFVDGGKHYLRRGGNNLDNVEELSIMEGDDPKIILTKG